MLHRMTTLLSAVVVLVAAIALNAALATPARAADNCIARPGSTASTGSRWVYQTNRFIHRKCWILKTGEIPAGGKATVQNIALPGLTTPANPTEFAAARVATGCTSGPTGGTPRGLRWSYHRDGATGQRCWQLGTLRHQDVRAPGAAASRISGGSLKRSRESEKWATPAVVVPQAVKNARAELLDSDIALLGRRLEPVSLPAPIASVVEGESPASVTFASRWSYLPEPVSSSNRRLSSSDYSPAEAPDPAVLRDVRDAASAGGPLFAAERPLYVTLLVFLAALGGALVLLGVIGGVLLYLRSLRARRNPPPGRDAFRDGRPPVPVQPAGGTSNVAGSGDPSRPDPQAAANPAKLRRGDADADGGHQAGHDRRTVVDTLIRQVGAGRLDRGGSLARQPDDIECS
jgi:hypothetical protein